MKLRFITKLFITVSIVVLLLRTGQIFILTETANKFLAENSYAASVIIGAAVVILLVVIASYTLTSGRLPVKYNGKGKAVAVCSAVSGVLYVIASATALTNRGIGWILLFVLSVLSAIVCFLFASAAYTDYRVPKAASLSFIVYWTAVLITSYIYYSERSLRVRTVYETFAVCFILLFSIVFGKAACGIASKKTFRIMYSTGLIGSLLCFVSVVPETIAVAFGASDYVAESAASEFALMAGGIFALAMTLNTFKDRNIRRSPILYSGSESSSADSAHEDDAPTRVFSKKTDEADEITDELPKIYKKHISNVEVNAQYDISSLSESDKPSESPEPPEKFTDISSGSNT